ncbi:MAG: site-2 protease family protein, partial [Sciscionella sp.]
MANSTSAAHPASGARGLLLFRIRAVPVLLAPSWWIGSAVIAAFYLPLVGRILPGSGLGTALVLAISFALLLGLSVLAHELGHCIVALRMGIDVRRLRLFLLGGITEMTLSPRKPRQEGLVAAAGPAVSALLAVLFGALWLVLPSGTAGWLLIGECAVANLAVAVFNVLPGLPLDGGRMLRAVIWGMTGNRRTGTLLAVLGAGLVAAALTVWALVGLVEGSSDRWLRLVVCLFTGWFVVAGASEELAASRERGWPAGLRLTELLRPALQLPAESPVADALSASAGRGIVLVRADGVAAGLLDEGLAARLAAHSPGTPAEQAAESIRPDNVLLYSDPVEEILERVAGTASWQFLVVDGEGRPAGVLRRTDLRAALQRHRGG